MPTESDDRSTHGFSDAMFAVEMATQVQYIRIAWQDLNEALPTVVAYLDRFAADEQSTVETNVEIAAFDRVWYSVNALLSAANRIRLILWPVNSSNARGQRLRSRVGVANLAALNVNGVRHSLEHYDERLEEWLTRHPGRAHGPSIWRTHEKAPTADGEAADAQRVLDPETFVVAYEDGARKDRLSLVEIVDAAEALDEALRGVPDFTFYLRVPD